MPPSQACACIASVPLATRSELPRRSTSARKVEPPPSSNSTLPRPLALANADAGMLGLPY